jgi:hypothetical protein
MKAEILDKTWNEFQKAVSIAPAIRLAHPKFLRILGISPEEEDIIYSSVCQSIMNSEKLITESKIHKATIWLNPPGRAARLFFLVELLQSETLSLRDITDHFCLETSVSQGNINYRGAYRLLKAVHDDLGLIVKKDATGKRYIENEAIE